ncbi:hypothetical protein OS493_000292 [Desmophyllum pertusum]|uniref:Uncharacterized protein n=1 Tax=Desmophyllum pertusum TaxID=174260 RepID=A0A9X0DCD2_9CNID|nr:hypothetical protein OS493_000292 [Desmophyllum pertusum]
MQVLTVLVFTMFALSLLSQAVKASPVSKGDNERKEDHRALAVEKNKEFKRICGMSLICDPFYSNGKRSRIQPRHKRINGGYPPYRQVNDQEY